VLQYPGDDGNYWSVKSWYVTLDVGTVESQEVPLAVGDFVFGNMTQVGPSVSALCSNVLVWRLCVQHLGAALLKRHWFCSIYMRADQPRAIVINCPAC